MLQAEKLAGGFDITSGQLIEDYVLADQQYDVPHSLNRVPVGAVILKSSLGCRVESTTSTTVHLDLDNVTVTLWVV
jgi:hypothetical protein